MDRYRKCANCSKKYRDYTPDGKYMTTQGCDADLRTYLQRPYICTGYYGAYDYGCPIYFRGIQTLEELQKKYPKMVEGCDICDDCLHQFVEKDQLEIMCDKEDKLVLLKTIVEKGD